MEIDNSELIGIHLWKEALEECGTKIHVALAEPDYYTRYPPLGLLKLSTFHKDRGDTVELVGHNSYLLKDVPHIIYITSLFSWELNKVVECAEWYRWSFPGSRIFVGGIAASLYPEKIARPGIRVIPGTLEILDELLPDYSLIPDWDGSIIFSSRGCINKCKFCAVPAIEGELTARKSIKHLIYEKHSSIIIWDNNFLASPYWSNIIDELIESNKIVDFNQGLDARLLNDENVKKLVQLRLKLLRLAYDQESDFKYIERAIKALKNERFNIRKILVYCLFNFNESPKEFLIRLQNILNLGVSVYPMRYQPLDSEIKDSYVSKSWYQDLLNLVAKSRRVLGFNGAFPPYKGLVEKFNNATTLEEALELRPKQMGVAN